MSILPSAIEDTGDLYLDLLKKTLTRYSSGESVRPIDWSATRGRRLLAPVARILEGRGLRLMVESPFDSEARAEGKDCPPEAETMIGLRRLENIQKCIVDVLARGVRGDLIETGAWRGGACIFMRAVLKACHCDDRTVWVADSFQGLPPPDTARYPADADDPHWSYQHLAVSVDQVKSNFKKYGLLDDKVRFLPGWFRDTLPSAPMRRLALLRLDGDMYESTLVALRALYPKLSPGGYVIVDDYGALESCRAAVTDFRREMGIDDAISRIDWTGVYWQREGV